MSIEIDENTKLKVALEESKTRERIAISELQKMRQRAEKAEKTIDKACKCYCDDICDRGRLGMCFHKHDSKGQVKNTFRYNECNELKLIRKAMEE